MFHLQDYITLLNHTGNKRFFDPSAYLHLIFFLLGRIQKLHKEITKTL